MKISLALVSVVSVATASIQEPTLEERAALFERYERATELVRWSEVRPRWLADGSSFRYRAGARVMFVDPAEGAPRRATREDREREPAEEPRSTGRRVTVVDGNLAVEGEGLATPVRVTDDAEKDVRWSVEPGGLSADGSMLFSVRLDAREVHHLPVVDFRQAVETVEYRPYIKTGTPLPHMELVIFHLPEGRRTDVDLGADGDLYVFPIGWREGDGELLFLRLNREATRLDLMAADPASGESRVILTERQETFVGGLDFIVGGWRETFRAIDGTDRFLWMSERDGWRHVYQYDYQGELIGRVTHGAFPVLRIVDVDAERQRVFVMANAEKRVYDTHFYRAELAEAELEGAELRRLTEAVGEHAVQLSPSKLYFVDTHSSLDRPPVSELRDVDGGLISRLAAADVSGLDELGYTPPEPFVVKAADGETDLHGVLFKPAWFDPEHDYPVIDYIYSGPFITMVPGDFLLSSPFAQRARSMAQLGFVTFVVDPRGTIERSKAFQDASYGRIGEIEIPDHVATLRQLASERPYMDLDRVGIYGFSWGGYFALRAMLTAPDVFHVGVAGAPGELTEAATINEPYMRLPENNPEGYAAGLNAPLAANLQGRLLIMHGTADVNAPFSTSMRMVEALIEADRPFDLLVLPGATHYFEGSHQRYSVKRTRAYFLEHLRGESGQ